MSIQMSAITLPDKPSTLTERRWFVRLLEIFPGFISWLFILAPVFLSIVAPVAVAYFILAFDLYWLLKALRMTVYLLRGYRRMRRTMAIDWNRRLDWLTDPERHLPKASPAERELLQDIAGRANAIMDPRHIIHLAIVATYNESRDVLEPTIISLTEANIPLDQLMVVIAYEERGGAEVKATAEALIKKYGKRFAYAVAIMHPDGVSGELKAKGANITFAARKLTQYLASKKIAPERVVVTTLDADNKPDRQYFPYLSYVYATDPNRIRKSYQPVPMFLNNIWDVPAPMRVIATGNSFFQIMEMMRPHRLRNFSSHAQPLRALLETDFWSVTSPVEDGHQFWRSFFTFNGDYSVVPLYIPVYQDAVLAPTYRRTFIGQYKQLRRWAYGVSDFSYVMVHNIRNKNIPFLRKVVPTWRLFEGHVSWATATLLITFVAWLPLFLNERFSHYQLAHQLPVIASYIQRVALLGALIMIYVSIISLPPRPERYKRRRNIAMVLQWVMLPVTGILFTTLAAVDSQTRLIFGRYLGFNVTEKSRVVDPSLQAAGVPSPEESLRATEESLHL